MGGHYGDCLPSHGVTDQYQVVETLCSRKYHSGVIIKAGRWIGTRQIYRNSLMAEMV
jgi:hypothetical protein